MKDILLSSSLAACVLLSAVFFLKRWLLDIITNSVKHKYSSDLEVLKHQFKQNEASLNLAHKAILDHSPAFREKQFESLDLAWNEILRIDNLYPELFLFLDIRTNEEVRESHHNDKYLKPILIESNVRELLMQVDLAPHRPYIDPLPWALFSVYRQITYRIINLYCPDLSPRNIEWFDDTFLQQVINNTLNEKELREFQLLKVGKIRFLKSKIENDYLKAMRNQLSGFSTSESALREAKKIMEGLNEL